MKKSYFWLMAFALGTFALGAASCDDDDKGENPPPTTVKLTVDPSSIADFPAAGSTQTFTVTTEPADAVWDAVPTEKWASVNKSGNKFTVTVGENTDAERTNAITVSAKNAKPVVLNFKQAAPQKIDNTLEISGTFDFPAIGGEQTLTITSNTAWTISTTYNEGDGWLTYSAASGTGDAAVTVTASENSPTKRTAVIKVQATDDATLFKTVNVTQAAAEQSKLFIDELVGDWTYRGTYLQFNSATEEWSAYDDDHQLTVTKIDDTTLKIDNIIQFQEGAPAYHNAITALVDNTAKTVTINQQVFSGGTLSWDEDGWDVYFTPYIKEPVNNYDELWGASFENVPVTGEAGSYVINLKALGVEWGKVNEVPAYSTFLPLTVVPGAQPSSDNVYWYSQIMADVVFEQGAYTPDPAKKSVKKAVKNSSFFTAVKARYTK